MQFHIKFLEPLFLRHVLKPGLDYGLWTVDCGLWIMDCGLCPSFIINRGEGVDPSLS